MSHRRDGSVARLTKEALAEGFNHFKMKVGANVDDDLRRGKLIRSIIDDPQFVVVKRDPESKELEGKNAGPTGSVLMIDANQVWDVQQAIDYVTKLKEIKPWFIEEPTAPDDILGHAAIGRLWGSFLPKNLSLAILVLGCIRDLGDPAPGGPPPLVGPSLGHPTTGPSVGAIGPAVGGNQGFPDHHDIHTVPPELKKEGTRRTMRDFPGYVVGLGERSRTRTATIPLPMSPSSLRILRSRVDNALWYLFSRSRGKPLWKPVVGFTPEELVKTTAWGYISDAITKEERRRERQRSTPSKNTVLIQGLIERKSPAPPSA
ncbi:enolase C-terminal domain-like protein [Macrolepiota fuliginosa MF-IS2]|uniref:Enolase C-terminal domain-like protein n=1 Tax=Macrolepiota fuliginosa MF-IS2 TaxID=1400762 RepID=A0A9P5X2B6_9AGAR|nr:enolase C-terminal domain-like protein [Macrolepiota fuliginosa MF-IS2]